MVFPDAYRSNLYGGLAEIAKRGLVRLFSVTAILRIDRGWTLPAHGIKACLPLCGKLGWILIRRPLQVRADSKAHADACGHFQTLALLPFACAAISFDARWSLADLDRRLLPRVQSLRIS